MLAGKLHGINRAWAIDAASWPRNPDTLWEPGSCRRFPVIIDGLRAHDAARILMVGTMHFVTVNRSTLLRTPVAVRLFDSGKRLLSYDGAHLTEAGVRLAAAALGGQLNAALQGETCGSPAVEGAPLSDAVPPPGA